MSNLIFLTRMIIMKKIIPALLIGFLMCFVVNAYMDNAKTALANGVIRLHVVANSDSGADQSLKLKVRDKILSECGNEFSLSHNIDAVSADILTSLDHIKKIAEDEIAKNGYNYDVNVSYGTQSFPRKSYGDITFPKGDYQALKVVIGNGSGKNWWCVLFPPLCFVDEACVSVDTQAQDYLKNQLGSSAYSMVTGGVEFKLKSYELWQSGKALVNNAMMYLSTKY